MFLFGRLVLTHQFSAMSYIRRIAEEFSQLSLSADELSLYARHLLLPGIGTAGQLKLKAARVLVIGSGGLGCPVLQALAGAGVGTLTVMDPDLVDRSNLARQWLHGHDDIGRNKAESAVEAVRRMNPHIKVEGFAEAFDSGNAVHLVEAHDIIVDATDDFDARVLIDEICSELVRPWVHAALYRDRFQVSIFWAHFGARYADLFPAKGEALDCATAGVLGATAAIAGNHQAWEVIKLVTACELAEVGSLLNVHAPSLSVSKFALPGCEQPEPFTIAESRYGNAWSIDRLRQALSIHEPIEIIDLRVSDSNESVFEGARAIRTEAILENPSLITQDRVVCLICETGAMSGMLALALNSTARARSVVHLEGGVG